MRVVWWRCGGSSLLVIAFIAILRCSLTPYNKAQDKALNPVVPKAMMNHIVDETEPLFWVILPNRDTLHIKVHPARSFQSNGSRRNLWQVECLDDKGNEIAYLLWDDTNKRAVLISRIVPVTTPTKAAPVHKQTAIATARAWMARLGLAQPDEAQTFPCEVLPGTKTWCFRMYLPEGTATLWMNARSGEFVQAKMHLPSTASSLQTSSGKLAAPAGS